MTERKVRLRTVLTAITTAVTLLALGMAGSLLLMTQYLNRTSTALAAAVENVRAIEETQIALLMHERTREPERGREFEEEMLRNLRDVRNAAPPDGAHDALSEAEELVRVYIAGTHTQQPPADLGARFASAFRALDEVSDFNIAGARQARETAANWDRRLNVFGTLTACVVLMLTGWLLWWMRTQAFQPVLDLATAMDRFGRGERDARALERGPAELRDMIERFNQMAAALAAQREAQVAFLAGVAHDLRNPLAALVTSVSLIPANQPLPPEPRIRRTLELVQRQLKKLERMVSDLMDMTQIDAGRLDLHIERQDVAGLVRDVVQLFEATAPEQRIELSLPDEPVAVDGDSLRIEQVVSNLISNAIKYSPSARKIEVCVRRERADALVEVRDYGIGISDEDQRRVFEPFHRASLAKETIPGAGLGLYVVRRLVDAHGGKIEVWSKPGQGARFSVRLPLAGLARMPSAAEAVSS